MEIKDLVRYWLIDGADCVRESVQHEPFVEGIFQASSLIVDCLRHEGTVFACGNGGSAADADHLVAELLGKFSVWNRRSLRAVSLASCGPVLTALANDYGYDQVFSRQLEGLVRPGDVLVAISTSGQSYNVIQAVRMMKNVGGTVIGMTGLDAYDEFFQLSDAWVCAPWYSAARIQESHRLAIHAVCHVVDQEKW